MKRSTIASLIGLAFTSPTFAAETINLNEIEVKENRFNQRESETTYASEIHTAKQIEASGAATLYDYLAQQSSLNIGSTYGAKVTPSINLRGYGGENGAQNVVIIVDGRRINSIDSVPQLIAAIPLGNIERIEIVKGSGSVVYGDGATAGVIQIFTKNKTGVTVSTSFGNYGQQNHYINAGISEKYFDLSVNLAHDGLAGYSNPDLSGNKDKSASNTQNVKLKLKPTADLNVFLEATNSNNDIRYPDPLSQLQFNANPRQNISAAYTHQTLDSQAWRLGASFNITPTINISSNYYKENKNVSYVPSAPYKNTSDAYDLLLSFCNEALSVTGGAKISNGSRNTGSNITSKDSGALFSLIEYRPLWLSDALTVSAGLRNEKIKYQYSPTVGIGSQLNDDRSLNAWDVGANYRLSSTLSLFTNFNQSFLAPNIDAFFTNNYPIKPTITSFNGFIQPQQVKTINLGVNQIVDSNRFKATAFYSHLNNEIFYSPDIYRNTNIDKSHKYGLELQDSYKFNEHLSTSLIYNYTRAIIDQENNGGGAFNGKDLPGAPKHSVTANLNYQFLEHANFNLNQTWRSTAYAYNDFANTLSQKQSPYLTTNVALSYQYKNVQLFTSINNLFAHENSIQIEDNYIYPVDFVRTWRVGMKADF